jgi:hypothetical protein
MVGGVVERWRVRDMRRVVASFEFARKWKKRSVDEARESEKAAGDALCMVKFMCRMVRAG